MREVGPVKVISAEFETEASVRLPLATFETPLWPSTHRGTRVCNLAGGIVATLVDDRMTRSVLIEADSAYEASRAYHALLQQKEQLQAVVSQQSRFARLLDLNAQILGSLLYLRFELFTGDAAGHNMVTLAAECMLNWILEQHPALRYVSISGNYCSDKKVSAVNGILGRGKYVVAEVSISQHLCEQYLRTTPDKIVQLNIKKNLLGNILSGGLRTANAHFANTLLAFYLATGQDAANIVEASQGMVHTEQRGPELYFSVTLPNLIVGSVGRGKELAFAQKNLMQLGCVEVGKVGYNARRLALMAAVAVLCAELSLLAAQTNPGELVRSHLRLERKKKRSSSIQGTTHSPVLKDAYALTSR